MLFHANTFFIFNHHNVLTSHLSWYVKWPLIKANCVQTRGLTHKIDKRRSKWQRSNSLKQRQLIFIAPLIFGYIKSQLTVGLRGSSEDQVAAWQWLGYGTNVLSGWTLAWRQQRIVTLTLSKTWFQAWTLISLYMTNTWSIIKLLLLTDHRDGRVFPLQAFTITVSNRITGQQILITLQSFL